MVQVVKVPVQRLTEAAFAPYGEVIGVRDRLPEFQGGGGSDGWVVDFQAEGRPQILVVRTPFLGFRFSRLERHHAVTQSFIPLRGSPAVVAVASADPQADGGIPPPETVRAFLLDGSAGYVLGKGTWHTLDRFPLYPPGSLFAVLTDEETTADLPAPGRGPSRLTQEVDYRAERGIVFELRLPAEPEAAW